MVQVVVILNVLISLLCLYVAWQVWNLRRTLAATTVAMTIVERNTYAVLHGAPQAISQGQVGVHGLRDRYQQLELQLQKLQQVLTFLALIQSIWRVGLRRGVVPDGSASPGRGSPSKRLRRLKRYRKRR
ncbi:MAG TPA: hypothetical protein V6D14_06310 [Coleofasciculaceae cyanobacterium]|jgi:hypothetical protein